MNFLESPHVGSILWLEIIIEKKKKKTPLFEQYVQQEKKCTIKTHFSGLLLGFHQLTSPLDIYTPTSQLISLHRAALPS